MPRVGVLWHAASAEAEEEYLGALTKAFHELGYFEGKNIDLEHRFPAEQPERFRALAHDLAESKVDVIVAVTGLGAREPKRATSTIPIVVCTRGPSTRAGSIRSTVRQSHSAKVRLVQLA
jgi:putative tryptophan/tyrosine transport system substrate-binding protein